MTVRRLITGAGITFVAVGAQLAALLIAVACLAILGVVP